VLGPKFRFHDSDLFVVCAAPIMINIIIGASCGMMAVTSGEVFFRQMNSAELLLHIAHREFRADLPSIRYRATRLCQLLIARAAHGELL